MMLRWFAASVRAERKAARARRRAINLRTRQENVLIRYGGQMEPNVSFSPKVRPAHVAVTRHAD